MHQNFKTKVMEPDAVNIGSPRRMTIGVCLNDNNSPLDMHLPKQMNDPFGCVLTKRSSLALRPKNVFQRIRDKYAVGSSMRLDPQACASAVRLRSSLTTKQ